MKNSIEKVGSMLHFFYTALKFLNSKVLFIKRRKRRTKLLVQYIYKQDKRAIFLHEKIIIIITEVIVDSE